MGFFRKLTGAQQQVDAIKENAARQAEATRQAASQAQQQLMQTAKAAADSQALASARMVAETKASDAVSQPMAIADVQLDPNGPLGQMISRRRKASFRASASSGGVQI